MQRTARQLAALTFVAIGLLFFARSAEATPTLTLTFTPFQITSFNLSDAFAPSSATMDWIRWTSDTSPSDFTHKATGGGIIGTYTTVGSPKPTVSFDPSASSSGFSAFHWNDGDPLATDTPSTSTGGLLENTNSFTGAAGSVGTGYSLAVTPGAAGSGKFRLYVGVGNGVGSLTATLATATKTLAGPSQNESTSGAFTPNAGFFDVAFTGMQAGDSLNLSYKVSTDFNAGTNDGNFDHAYADLMAGALSFTGVPEPGCMGLLGLALARLLVRRRAVV